MIEQQAGRSPMMPNLYFRVLLVTVRADCGGGPEHLYQLLKHGNNQVSFYMACPQEEPYYDRYRSITRVSSCELPHRRFTFQALNHLVRYIHNNNIQLLHTHGKGAGIYGRLASFVTGIPCVHTPHGIHTGQYGTIKRWLYIRYENISSRWVKHVCFVSTSERKEAQNLSLWLHTNNTVIPNGVEDVPENDRLVWRAEIRDKLGIQQQMPIIAMLSRFDYQKNMFEAYEIAKYCPDVQFIWIGDGEDRAILEKKVEKEGITNIMFAGFIDETRPYLAASDIYLSTSLWEGMPLGVLEAMSVGLPVVASDVPGNCDAVVNGKTGYLYPLDHPLIAVGHIRNILQNRELYKKLSSQATNWQKNQYSIQGMVDKIIHVYSKYKP